MKSGIVAMVASIMKSNPHHMAISLYQDWKKNFSFSGPAVRGEEGGETPEKPRNLEKPPLHLARSYFVVVKIMSSVAIFGSAVANLPE